MNNKSIRIVTLVMLLVGTPSVAICDHRLREIERRCEVEWNIYGYDLDYGDDGDLDCRTSVSDRRNLERKCEAEWNGYEGEFDCRGSHYRNVERKCEIDEYGDIDC